MTQIISQLLKLPLEAFVFGMQMLAKTVQGMQKLADSGIDAILGKGAPSSGEEQGGPNALDSEDTSSTTESAVEDSAQPKPKEEGKMPDNSLSNDLVKVVQYTILTVKPDHEHALKGFEDSPRTKTFTDNMTGEDFSSWVIADYFHEPDHERIDEEDKKYLRVSYSVTSTFAPEDANYPKKQVEVLEVIAKELKQKPPHKP